jgi:hypothetical protein
MTVVALVVLAALLFAYGSVALATPISGVTSVPIAKGHFGDIDARSKTEADPGTRTNFWQAAINRKGTSNLEILQNTIAPDMRQIFSRTAVLMLSAVWSLPGHSGKTDELGGTTQAVEEFGPWEAPINAGEPLNTPYNDMYAVLTRSQLTVYFTSDRPGGLGGDDLWMSTRASLDSPWEPPVNLAALNSPSADSLPMLTTSGNIMYFYSNRPGGCGAGDLWQAKRQPSTGQWSAPVNLGCVVNSAFEDNAPAFYASDDLGYVTLYFGSNRPGGIGDFDVYQTTTTDEDLFNATWTPGVLVPELSSPSRDTRTFVRSDGLEVFITSDRAGGTGGLDIWTATRNSASDPWSTPVNPGMPLNSTAAEGSPTLTSHGNTMYFFSTRPGGYGLRDIWITHRNTVSP